MTLNFYNSKNIIFILLTLACVSGCASTSEEIIPASVFTPEEILMAKEIWKKVEERNKTIETDPEWIRDSYEKIKVKSLTNVPLEKYADYKKFVDNGKVYIINHPAFYTFFQHSTISRKNGSLTKNIMNIVIDGTGEDSSEETPVRLNRNYLKTIKEFERIGRNFMEFKSTEKKLVILVLPGIYKKYPSFRYKNGPDEYSRYINDATNGSESVLYIESKKPNRGQLTYEDLNTLIEFLQKIGATSIMLGGEYIGRCEEELYRQISETIDSSMTIGIVPELSPPSPDDMNSSMRDMFDSDNKLDVQAAIYNIVKNKYDKLEVPFKIKTLDSRMVYEKPDTK